MTIFGIDAASYQGTVNWATVDRVCDFGFEKVTQATNYLNPYWPAAKSGMLARARATGFLPGAYLFMEQEDGARQADYFAAKAGDLTGFAIAVDLERSAGENPTISQAKACVARLRKHYPGHPIGGYAPHWYTGTANLEFFDWLWASHYVSGTGSPAALYAKVPSSWWAAYGGRTPTLLQFSSSATVAGVSGRVDISAYRGSLDQFRAIALGEEDMAFTADDKKWLTETLVPAVVRAVLTSDIIPAPGSNPDDPWDPAHNPGFDPAKNKTWAGQSVGKQTIQGLIAIDNKLDRLGEGGGVVDPEVLADKLAPKVAPLVADELAKRLES